ncbi:MFS transporter [Flavobacterium lindanitolerans]|nr:MFS transporter [Flavobacterium lindanitolerans]
MNKSIYIMALGAFGIITTEFGVIGILPTLAKEFQVSIDTAGWLLSAFALTVAVAGPFTTMLTAKINRKTIMCAVLAVFVISNLLSVISPNFTMLMIARIVPAFCILFFGQYLCLQQQNRPDLKMLQKQFLL